MKKFPLSMKHSIIFMMISTSIHALDNPHFWRATNFLTQFYEPRVQKAGLLSFDATVGYGKTHTGRNGCDEKTELLNIYGPQNMAALGINVPGKDLSNPADISLLQVELLPNSDNFGKLIYKGTFNLTEANFSLTQNLTCGFFVQAHIPVRRMQLNDICFCDESPIDCNLGPNQETPQWQTFLSFLPTILAQYGIQPLPECNANKAGVGDFSLYTGWTHNYEETQELDYVDTTFRIGILIPTGRKQNVDLIFDIANGYNGHFAVPVSFDFAVGMYEWLTAGFHFGSMIFVSKDRLIRMKTDNAQTGIIKLAKGAARVTPGIIWEVNGYLKADHVIGGLSLLAGYSLALQKPTTITPCQTTTFNPNIVCCDAEYLGWKMSTFQFYAEYDFSRLDSRFGPRVGFFYNAVIGGQRIFNTNMGGGQVGFDLLWCF